MAQIAEGMRNNIKRDLDQEASNPPRPLTTISLGTRGTVAALVALAAPVLVMALALSIELTGWTVTEIQLQRSADMAATAGALAYINGASVQLAATEAAYVAEINGATGSTTRTWNSGTQVLTDNLITVAKVNGVKNPNDVAFKVTIQQNVPRLFSSLVLSGGTKALAATATGEVTTTVVTSQIGAYCILALGSGTGISLSNGVSVDTSQCGVQDNSNLSVVGGAKLTAGTVSASGSITVNNGGTLTVSGTETANATTPGVNPYANVAVPPTGTCAAQNSFTNGASMTISPGTFCNGLTITGYSSSQTTITMNPGVYIVDAGNFSLQNATVNATGVTIVLTGSSPSSIGTAQISNGSALNLTAPTTGATRGIAFMQDPTALSSSSNSFAGGSSMNIVGALDFSNSIVNFSNGTNNTANCTQLIAYQVVFLGGSKFGNNCSGTGTSGIGALTSTTYSAALAQ